MSRLRLLVLLIIFYSGIAHAQKNDDSHLRFSLLTVGVGDEIYASFGHTGIRMTDSALGTDMVYNWGTFDGYQDNFELKFMRGKVMYYASAEPYQNFYATYVHERRGVEEQEIFLNDAQKLHLQSYLQDTALSEGNRYYKYDFLYDNCATRLRDVFPKTFGASFHWGQALPPHPRRTFRDEIHQYLRYLPWERFGIDLLLGAGVDKVMRNEDAMFLPDYLRNGLDGATVDGRRIAAAPVRILPAAPAPAVPANGPLILCLAWAALIVLGTAIPGIRPVGLLAANALLLTTGLLGCLMLFMWLGTDHLACRNNWNVLWCLPTNLIIPFVKRQKRGRYALVALLLFVVALLIHLFHLQALPLRECWPLWVALIACFGMIYRSAKAPDFDAPDHHHHH